MTINHKLILKEVGDYVGITLGLLLFTFGFTFFLMPYEIVTGGVAGIGAIIYYTTHFPISYTYFIINGVLLVVGLRILGWKFLTKTIYAILMLTFLLGLAQQIIPKDEAGNFVRILGDGQDFMSLVIGCMMTGSALGIVFVNNGSTGGSDIIAASVNKFYNMSLGTVLLLLDMKDAELWKYEPGRLNRLANFMYMKVSKSLTALLLGVVHAYLYPAFLYKFLFKTK